VAETLWGNTTHRARPPRRSWRQGWLSPEGGAHAAHSIAAIRRELRERRIPALLEAGAVLFVEDQAVEDGQDLLAIAVDAVQIFAEGSFEIMRAHPFVEQSSRNINILPAACSNGMARVQYSIKPNKTYRIITIWKSLCTTLRPTSPTFSIVFP